MLTHKCQCTERETDDMFSIMFCVSDDTRYIETQLMCETTYTHIGEMLRNHIVKRGEEFWSVIVGANSVIYR